jgi:hypothetical protein
VVVVGVVVGIGSLSFGEEDGERHAGQLVQPKREFAAGGALAADQHRDEALVAAGALGEGVLGVSGALQVRLQRGRGAILRR